MGGTVMLQSTSMYSRSSLGQQKDLANEVMRSLDQLIQRYLSTRAKLVSDEDLAKKAHKELLARSVRLKRRAARASVGKGAELRRRMRELSRIKTEVRWIHGQKIGLHEYLQAL